ncbi:MAG: pseudouridine synthase [Betaproteobacteria bacterium]|nr:pseudouridine synthase [Betaproteobacteria bacterium]NCP81402.1 pseudouridine synthase [Rhodoferax sp.]NCS61004.1 pseudouridine synthase [Rhodoferax sp.]PIZ23810.1 MAG: pseudouridine synthase [Comamonadaceae bacterium CG_4_10_14_0_8_um_filter_57_29]PJC22431.1 MAG: pseudouridine synthase [Comamonadaceae bacterium CG_4_9_14_0_8_um_filter_57_21]
MKGFKPPTRNGVGPSCVALPAGTWLSLLDFLAERFPNVSRQTWLERFTRGDVFNETGQRISCEQAMQAPYPAHSRLYYYRDVPFEAPIPFDEVVLFENAHLIVVDKPHFLPVVPSGGYLNETVLVRLKRKLGLDDLVPIHRIDRDTAGLVMFSKQPASRAAYCALFSQHAVRKTYEAIAPWRADLHFPLVRQSRIQEAGHFMLQQEVSGPVNAITHIDVLEVRGDLARYQLKPVTGQRHQLRVHMLALGLPLLGDGLYPTLTPEGQLDYTKPLQLLAKELTFADPVSGVEQHFTSQRTLTY